MFDVKLFDVSYVKSFDVIVTKINYNNALLDRV